jgi:hypothetical protein
VCGFKILRQLWSFQRPEVTNDLVGGGLGARHRLANECRATNLLEP